MAKAIIIPDTKTLTKSVKATNFFKSKIKFRPGRVKVEEVLPFRVKFVNIGITSYSSKSAAPIGIAIIGISNYVM